MDYEIQRFTRRCAVSGRELKSGEVYYSALMPDGATVARRDFAAEVWTGPPDEALGWWKAEVPPPDTSKPQWAPNDAMLELFDTLADQLDAGDMRYVLTLLLVRRRVLRLEDTEKNDRGDETMLVFCPRRQAEYRVPVVMPTPERAAAIQELFAKVMLKAA